MENLIILLPTYNRQHYLNRQIHYYMDWPFNLYILDSTPTEYTPIEALPSNIHYEWTPDKSFFQKIDDALHELDAKFFILTPDDDYLNRDTLEECLNAMNDKPLISMALGAQIYFDKPYHSYYFFSKAANGLYRHIFSGNPVDDAYYFGNHYQNIHWSLYRADVITKAFDKLQKYKPQNANFAEHTMAFEACVGGFVYVSKNVLNYRENTTEVHWGTVVPDITKDNVASDSKLKQDLEIIMGTYQGESRRIVDAFMAGYWQENKVGFLKRCYCAFKRRILRIPTNKRVHIYQPVERIITEY